MRNHGTLSSYNDGCRCQPCAERKRRANVVNNARVASRRFHDHPPAWVSDIVDEIGLLLGNVP